MRPIRITRLVERWETAVTMVAMQRARWRCESCASDTDLRVVEDWSENFLVLCPSCRLASVWVSALTRARPSHHG